MRERTGGCLAVFTELGVIVEDRERTVGFCWEEVKAVSGGRGFVEMYAVGINGFG